MNNNYLNISPIRKYYIYDVFHACGKLKILTKGLKKLHTIRFQGKKPTIHQCRKNFTIIFEFKMKEYQEEVNLIINGTEEKTKVNKYIDTKDEIIITTVTKDQDNYIIPWIEYNKHIGVKRFMIYDNSKRGTLGVLLDKYIKDQTVLLFNFAKVAYRKKGKLLAQSLQQNHSLHAFKNAKYIGMLDIDEYMNPQRDFKSLPKMFNKLLKRYRCKYENLAGFSFQNKYFFNPKKENDRNYNHLNIPFCSKGTTKRFRKKMFINPANVSNFTIHLLSTYDGKDLLISSNDCFFNHYRYLGNRFRNDGNCNSKDWSILRHLNWLDKDKIT